MQRYVSSILGTALGTNSRKRTQIGAKGCKCVRAGRPDPQRDANQRNRTQADVAIMRLGAPFETLHPGYVFGAVQHEDSLAFRDGDAEFEAFKRVSAVVPTIVTIYLDRPAILTPLKDRARAVIANFGVSDEALLDVLTGRASPAGKLPFEIPSSMSAVEAQRGDVPYDSPRPLYRFSFGRRY